MGSILVFIWLYVEVDGIFDMCKWIWYFVYGIFFFVFLVSFKFDYEDFDGDIDMFIFVLFIFNKFRRILIYCVDGYIELIMFGFVYYFFVIFFFILEVWLVFYII